VFVPEYFEFGEEPLFTEANRKYPICFRYPYSQKDDVEIVIPEGYAFENPSKPTTVGDVKGALGVAYKVQIAGKGRRLVFRREFALGGNGAYQFKAESYPAIQNLFAEIRKSDSHSFVIKPKPIDAPAPAGSQTGDSSNSGAAAPSSSVNSKP
jgi:hypothetical protein